MQPIFITGIGTDAGKTVASAVVVQALRADYWKPVQAGLEETDSDKIRSLTAVPGGVIHPESYRLKLPASPHIAAREEGIRVSVSALVEKAGSILPANGKHLVIEGAGGLLVPLNERETVADLIKALNAKLILVSRNYLGSINHSLLTAECCRSRNIPVLGWIFNDQYMSYEEEIAGWSGYPVLGNIPLLSGLNRENIAAQAAVLAPQLTEILRG
ncbi:dethiobiotin synthase [Sediminibacterium ginsengisoli]|uniref:ATP-dependent dethiobiotin synthetase BioD n=1 Tax=Sediminibacterium ginsengisoli TaxID=413434 RepID=A0A1T4PSQ3_9BACT|nr:dethiobiotin synthase [Sediminibacterium ginsengisoli]SJZ94311.1 dethiobiotin synthetase [Sediminibacterium ginsengisoli]